MWLFIGGTPEQRSFIYHYYATRATQVAMDFFEDFNAYTALGKQDYITHLACMVHANGYCAQNQKKQKGLAY